MIRKTLGILGVVALLLCTFAFTTAPAHAATVTPSSSTVATHTHAKVVKPLNGTVWCWLPHDFELVNPDATWCISGGGSVNTYHVSKITYVGDGCGEAQVNGEPVGRYDLFYGNQSRYYNNAHVTDLVVGYCG